MIKITKNTKEQVTFQKMDRDESWFNNDCSNENLAKEANREGETVTMVQFADGDYIGDTLHIYFGAKRT